MLGTRIVTADRLDQPAGRTMRDTCATNGYGVMSIAVP
jgi:hypothetical protein